MCFLPGIIHSLVKLIFTSGMFLYVHNKTMNNLYFCVIEAHYSYLICGLGFSGGSGGKESACSAGDAGKCWFDLRVGKMPWRGQGRHYCILAWTLPWTEGPGGLQSIGSRVRHDQRDWAICVSRVISIHCIPLKRIKTKHEHIHQNIFKLLKENPELM